MIDIMKKDDLVEAVDLPFLPFVAQGERGWENLWNIH